MLESKNKIAVTTTCDSMRARAKSLAHQLNLPFVNSNDASYHFLLDATSKRLELRETGVKNSKPIYVDFLAPALSYRIKHSAGNKQLIAKAIGIKGGIRPTVLDTTAGLGVDSFVLASLGCSVIMLERCPIIGALLHDGLERFNKKIKMELHVLQAIDYLNKIFCMEIEKPDTIYLDPMYPERKKSALGKKTMRVLHELVGADEDAADVLTLALKCAKTRVVVKRPSYAENLGLIKPNLQLSLGGSCRYDVYLLIN